MNGHVQFATGRGHLLLGESTSGCHWCHSHCVVYFSPRLVSFYFGANASCVSSFECSKIESADHTYFSSFSSIFVRFCSSSVHQLFLYIAFLLENVVC